MSPPVHTALIRTPPERVWFVRGAGWLRQHPGTFIIVDLIVYGKIQSSRNFLYERTTLRALIDEIDR